MYPIVYFDISGKCNGRCRWCYSGKKNLMGEKSSGTFIPPEMFQRALQYMLDNEIIGSSTNVKLYNWGEPMLHPQFRSLVHILNEKKLMFGISTNASVPFSDDRSVSMANLSEIQFSMPGFSQRSYDKIHGFNFEKIKRNISGIVNGLRRNGFTGQAFISYHVYQFNIDELREAVRFAEENNIFVSANYAYLANWQEYKDYLSSSMKYEDLNRASKELFLYYLDNQNGQMDWKAGFVCPQHHVLTMDEKCNVLTCCVVNDDHENYSIGNLFSLSRSEIDLLKKIQPVCTECLQAGVIQNLIQCNTVHKQLIPFFNG